MAAGALIFGMIDSFQLALQATGTNIPLPVSVNAPVSNPDRYSCCNVQENSSNLASLAIPYRRTER